ncbi:MAG TPA: hypothetical protein VLT16_00535 [Candidatus Limnocylindrales bacterium]|nr:hypothetical protein [Candidatus Limnocylindrales bacterium]
MLSEQDFNRLVDAIMSLGYGEEPAAQFAELIGDTPEFDGQGNTIVKQDGKVIARLPLKGIFTTDHTD